MRMSQRLLHVLFLFVFISFSNSETIGQDKSRLPPGLNDNSSLSEILTWLNKKGFPTARVGMNGSGPPTYDDPGVLISFPPSAKVIFSDGFRLTQLDSCHLVLRNEAVRILDFSGTRHSSDVLTLVEERKGNTAGQLVMWLEKLSYTKNRSPHRHTTDPAKAKLLGTWRTKFTYKGFFARDVFSMSFGDPGQGPMTEVMTTDTLTFAFDDREMSEQFNAAFRRAIKLCRGK